MEADMGKYIWVLVFWMVILSIWQPAVYRAYLKEGVPMYTCMYVEGNHATPAPGMCQEPMPIWVVNGE